MDTKLENTILEWKLECWIKDQVLEQIAQLEPSKLVDSQGMPSCR